MLDSTAGILIKHFSDHQPYFMVMDTTLKNSKFIQINIQSKKAVLNWKCLNWKRHTENNSNVCSKKIGILNKLKHVLSQQIKTLLYN